MNRLILALFVAVFVSSAQAQPVLVEAPARAYFYSEPDFRGECLVVEGSASIIDLAKVRDSRGRKWDDRIASFRTEGPALVTIYDDPRFRGERLELRREIRDFARLRHGETGLENWDRRISSLKVDTVAFVPQPPPPPVPRPFFNSQREADRAITRAYREILGREPDYAGLQTYRRRLLDEGWSEDAMRDQLRRSSEFHHRDFDDAVRRCFREVLGRDPDPRGLDTYVRAMRDKGWSENDVKVDLRRSDEAKNRLYTEIVTRAYRDILGRAPDPSGLGHYVGRMRGGWTEFQVREDLRRSDEYRRR